MQLFVIVHTTYPQCRATQCGIMGICRIMIGVFINMVIELSGHGHNSRIDPIAV